MTLDPKLLEYATDGELAILQAIMEMGGVRKAARALDRPHSTIRAALRRVEGKAAVGGYSPQHGMTHAVPDAFVTKGVSTLYDHAGNIKAQWVKSRLDPEKHAEILRATLAALAEDVSRVAALPAPASTVSSLCNLYTMTDCHMGMLAWHKEGGADWDLTIAERTLTGCFEAMVAAAPAARVGIVNQLGDFLHSDGLMPVTPTSGHIVDQDGRFSKMVGASVRVLRRLVDLALLKHEKVVVLMAEGNHDLASSVWLRVIFGALYENEPRVDVIDSELPYYVYRHGKVMLGFHHGHLSKNGSLPQLFAAQFREIWGQTTKAYIHTGHRHHEEVKEFPGARVIQHPTLSARDAYAARGGWISERQATVFTYHVDHGQVASATVTPEMLAEPL